MHIADIVRIYSESRNTFTDFVDEILISILNNSDASDLYISILDVNISI